MKKLLLATVATATLSFPALAQQNQTQSTQPAQQNQSMQQIHRSP